MAILRGYDAWKTREPDEGPAEDLRWYVELINPNNPRTKLLGPFDDEAGAVEAAEVWVESMRWHDPDGPYRDDYGYERPYSIDLNEDCTCGQSLRSRKFCPVHGIDPDTSYDARGE